MTAFFVLSLDKSVDYPFKSAVSNRHNVAGWTAIQACLEDRYTENLAVKADEAIYKRANLNNASKKPLWHTLPKLFAASIPTIIQEETRPKKRTNRQ
jgi:hypothetical protein